LIHRKSKKINFEKESYTKKADLALVQMNIGETETIKRIYTKLRLNLGKKQEKRIKKRETKNKNLNQKKTTPEAKRKRVENREG